MYDKAIIVFFLMADWSTWSYHFLICFSQNYSRIETKKFDVTKPVAVVIATFLVAAQL